MVGHVIFTFFSTECFDSFEVSDPISSFQISFVGSFNGEPSFVKSLGWIGLIIFGLGLVFFMVYSAMLQSFLRRAIAARREKLTSEEEDWKAQRLKLLDEIEAAEGNKAPS
mmetsp:Transcript_6430/g.15743  ORF Transcript_6430/g.15743 Transcript_6430/m.15743 type:complete len:111 (+) Transcript_6430:2928-3260(+)